MAGVGLVLDQHLPIAIVHVAQHAAGDLELAHWRTVDHVVEARQAFAEEFFEIEAAIVDLGEYETAVVTDMAHRRHSGRGMALLETGILVALLQGNREQGAVGLEAPGMVGAAEELSGVAAGL
jgi:hypothetical protein